MRAERGPLGEALEAPGEDLGRGAGVVEGSLLGCLVEEVGGVVAGRFGVDEGGGEGGPGGVVEDLVGVGGDGLAYALGVPFSSRSGWAALG